MAINFMHLLGRAPGLQSALICIHLSPCWMGSSHSEKCSKCKAKPSGSESKHSGADSIFTLYIFPRETGVWSLPCCRSLGIVSLNPGPSFLPLTIRVAAWLMNSSCPSLYSFTIYATFDSLSHHASPIRLPWCPRIFKLDYLTTSKWVNKLISLQILHLST